MTKVTVTAGSGAGVLAEWEVSGGREGKLYASESVTDTVGQDGSAIKFLTVKRNPKANAGFTVMAIDGPVEVEVDNGKAKKVGKGKSLAVKGGRIFIKEPAR